MSDDDRALLPFGGDDVGAGRLIRRQWHDGRWFLSVVDVIAVLTDSLNPRTYWAVLKKRLQDEGAGEPLTTCKQLKMRALDGKLRATDAADVETMLRIVQSIPSPKAEPIKQWLAEVATERLEENAESNLLAGMTGEQQRLFLRGQVADRNLSLAETAHASGVVTARDFAIFQDWGYRGLYAGETARAIAARKGLSRGQHILDWMGSEELAANWFRATQAEAKLRREGVTDKLDANRTHFAVGRKVRQTIADLGGTPPEQLPTPAESIAQLQRQERQRIEAQRQPLLPFPTDADADTPGDE